MRRDMHLQPAQRPRQARGEFGVQVLEQLPLVAVHQAGPRRVVDGDGQRRVLEAAAPAVGGQRLRQPRAQRAGEFQTQAQAR